MKRSSLAHYISEKQSWTVYDSPGLKAIHVWSVASATPSPENILMEDEARSARERKRGRLCPRSPLNYSLKPRIILSPNLR